MLPMITSARESVNLILIMKIHQIYQFTLILYSVWVLCDRRQFSVHSPFIEKSMSVHKWNTHENSVFVHYTDMFKNGRKKCWVRRVMLNPLCVEY